MAGRAAPKTFTTMMPQGSVASRRNGFLEKSLRVFREGREALYRIAAKPAGEKKKRASRAIEARFSKCATAAVTKRWKLGIRITPSRLAMLADQSSMSRSPRRVASSDEKPMAVSKRFERAGVIRGEEVRESRIRILKSESQNATRPVLAPAVRLRSISPSEVRVRSRPISSLSSVK